MSNVSNFYFFCLLKSWGRLYNRGQFRSGEVAMTRAFTQNSIPAYEYTSLKSQRAAARFFDNSILFGRVGLDLCHFAISGGQLVAC